MIEINHEFLPKHPPWYHGDDPEWRLSDGEGEIKIFKKGESRGQYTSPAHRCSICGANHVQIRTKLPKEIYGSPSESMEHFPVFLCDRHESMADMSVEELKSLEEPDLD